MPARPLVITADPQVLDDLLRVAAAVGVELEVAAEPGAARRAWSAAPLVVVGPDVAVRCARSRLPRRSDVVLLGDDLDDAGVWQLAVEVGAEHVMFLPDAAEWLGAALVESVDPEPASGAVVAVVGGRGGAGATTLAAALAVTGARLGRPSLLVDGDPLGGGIDLVLGGEACDGLRWPDLGATRGRLPGATLSTALPRVADLPVLSWDRGEPVDVPVDAVEAVLDAARRAAELVVVDLPRQVDDTVRLAASLADVLLLVVPAEVRAAAAAARVAARVSSLCHDVRIVVRGPSPSGLTGPDIARSLTLPLQGFLAAEPGLDRQLERGEPPGVRGGPLAQLAEELLDEVLPATRWAA